MLVPGALAVLEVHQLNAACNRAPLQCPPSTDCIQGSEAQQQLFAS
jgi:hypothetical protein